MTVTSEELTNRFTYHLPKGDQTQRYKALSAEAVVLAEIIVANVPPGREQDQSLFKLEEAMYYAKAGIARRE